MVKNLPAVQETWVQSLGWKDPLEKGTATHSSNLAWEIPWTEEPGGLQSMGSQRGEHDWAANTWAVAHREWVSDWVIQGKTLSHYSYKWPPPDTFPQEEVIGTKGGKIKQRWFPSDRSRDPSPNFERKITSQIQELHNSAHDQQHSLCTDYRGDIGLAGWPHFWASLIKAQEVPSCP